MRRLILALFLCPVLISTSAERQIANRGNYQDDGNGDPPFVFLNKFNANDEELFRRTSTLNSNGLPANTTAFREHLGLYLPINVKASPYNATGDGTTDDTVAIQAAIDAAGSGGSVFIPNGTYKVTDTLTVRSNRVCVTGMGDSSVIYFVPTSSKSCLRLGRTGDSGGTFNLELRNLRFISAVNEISKVAIECYDLRESLIDRVTVTQWTGAGTNSVALWWRGRDVTTIRDCHFQAGTPVKIDINPNSYLSADHVRFRDCIYVIEEDEGIGMYIRPDVYTSEFYVDGSFNGGRYGIYRKDDAAERRSIGFTVGPTFRHEQPTDTNSWGIYIDMSDLVKGETGNVLQNFLMQNGALNIFCNNVYLRGVYGATFFGTQFNAWEGATQLSADDSCDQIWLFNVFSQQTGVSTFTGLTNTLAGPTTLTAAMPQTAYYTRQANQPLKFSGAVIDGGLGVGLAAVPGKGRVYAAVNDGTSNTVSVFKSTRTSSDFSVLYPLRQSIPFTHDYGGGDIYAGELRAELVSPGNNTYTAMEVSVNPTNGAHALSPTNLVTLMRWDGPTKATQLVAPDPSTNSAYPLRVTRKLDGSYAVPTRTGIGFEEYNAVGSVYSRTASIAAERDNAHGWHGRLMLRVNGTNSPPASFDAMTMMLDIDGYDETIKLGKGSALWIGAGGDVALTNRVTFDASNTAGETRMLLWDVSAGTLKRVSVGAADSGGTGFKVLRVPN